MDLKGRIAQYNVIDKNLIPPFPRNMLIELTNLCNHNCLFCANSKMTRKKGEINEEFLFRILKEAFEEGTEEVGFYATGEPFVSKNLALYVAKAKEIGYKYVYITTNGALATPKRSIAVIEAGVDSIKFSINAGTKETYKIIHGKDEFNIVLDNLKYISDYRKKNNKNFKIFVSSIVTKYSEDEEEALEEKLKNICDEVVFLNVANQGGMMYEINEKLALEDDKYSIKKMPCSLPFNSLHVTYEGYLTACCIDFQNYLTVADLNKVSIKEAWNGKKLIELRRKHLEDSIEGTLCYNCIYNKNEYVEPLLPEHATYYDVDNFSNEEDIKYRLKNRI
ncbi:radical SAM protein [Clostridium bowmanii]|uniref:radical SAM/SPASM domain-containing protein n=1 Tax=Clostridium bowmanii TaxID=132925 RepID=UPI001C0CF5CC|nr:radical SAM/SPASM domain-containing protein [Clostridium bowmanii]MBU3190606.1 radical SAM protein [Clostridium bowmanii]MCA1075139.1 radical SAM protein [Clostridium bowmanii]